MSSVLLTGGLGFIGSNTLDLLLERGYHVIVLDNQYSGKIDNIKEHTSNPRLEIIIGDILDTGLLNKIMKKVDSVIHLAALVSVDIANKQPLLAFKVNAGGTLNLLEVSRKSEIERFVYASSAAVYGNPEMIPIHEKHPLRPLNPYGASKLAGEALVNAYSSTYGLSTICLRYFNVYGPKMSGGPYAGVISKFILNALANKDLEIFGDGNQTRDFVFVRDVANANIRALESKVDGIFNVGTGRGVTINQLADIIIKLKKSKSQKIYSKPRAGDIYLSVADISVIRRKLNWHPKVDLKDGITKTIKYFEKEKV